MVMSIFSCVSFLAQTSTITFQTLDADWTIVILSISLILGIATLIARPYFPEIIEGPNTEGAAPILLLLAWATTFPVILGPKLPWI
jgi:hypothetical protein